MRLAFFASAALTLATACGAGVTPELEPAGTVEAIDAGTPDLSVTDTGEGCFALFNGGGCVNGESRVCGVSRVTGSLNWQIWHHWDVNGCAPDAGTGL